MDSPRSCLEIKNLHCMFINIAALDSVHVMHCAVVPDRPNWSNPLFRWVVLIQTLQPATTQSSKGVSHKGRANRKRLHQRRANPRTCNDGMANDECCIRCGGRIGPGSRIESRSANGRVRSQRFWMFRGSWLSRGSRLSRLSRGSRILRGCPGAVIGSHSVLPDHFSPHCEDVQ